MGDVPEWQHPERLTFLDAGLPGHGASRHLPGIDGGTGLGLTRRDVSHLTGDPLHGGPADVLANRRQVFAWRRTGVRVDAVRRAHLDPAIGHLGVGAVHDSVHDQKSAFPCR